MLARFLLIFAMLLQPALLRLTTHCDAPRPERVEVSVAPHGCCPCCEDGACCGMAASNECTSKPTDPPARPASEGELAKSLAILTAILPTSWTIAAPGFSLSNSRPVRPATTSRVRDAQSLLCVRTT